MSTALFFRTLVSAAYVVPLAWHGSLLLAAAVLLIWAVPLLRAAVTGSRGPAARVATAGSSSPRG